jgi:uroporphyrinogen decarboxylase
VFLHSCGAIYDYLPDLIDAGVEVINPVQISARGMEPQKLKNEFGKDLVFWGGGANMQETAVKGSLQDIKDEVRRLIDIFSPGGGYVFTQVHNIQANVEPEKILAIYETAKEYRK